MLMLGTAVHSLRAQFVSGISKTGTTAGAFLEIGVGPRAVAMGGAFVGIADDVTATHWNVAGLARMVNGEVLFGHASWLIDTNFDYVAVALPLRNGTLAFHFTSLSIGEEPVRTVLDPEGTGATFGASSIAIGGAMAWNLTDRFSIGFNGKYVRETIASSSATAVALDFGTLFVTPFRGMRLGATIANFGPKLKIQGRDPAIVFDPDPTIAGNNDQIPAQLETDSFDLPLSFRVGVAMEVMEAAQSRLTLAIDADNPNNNTPGISIGAEYAFMERFFLRGGYNDAFERDSEKDLTLGAGIFQPLAETVSFRFDYAYARYGVLGNVHRFGIALGF